MTQQGYGSWRRDDTAATPAPDAPADSPGPSGNAPQRPRTVAAYPVIPNGSAPAPPAAAAPAGPRVATVALIASLIGALLGSTVMVLALRDSTPSTAPEVAEVPEEQPAQAAEVPVAGDRTQVEAVAEAVLPTVVQIDINGTGGVGTTTGNGSGVIYRSDGYIVTNNHVVEGADTMEVVFADGTRERAKLVGNDVLSDLAVIEVQREGLTAIGIGDSSQLRVGQLAVAIGSPFGLEGSVTAGVISALNRPIEVGQGQRIRLPNVIQTDAPINPGNSGGALVGADGRLIGINSAILTAGSPANAGVGFAVPVATVVDIADELIETGSVVYPFLGVEGANVPAAAVDRLGVEQGALITVVQPGEPADQAGLRADDVIVEMDGQEIKTMDDLIVAVRQAEVGDTVEVVYIRNRQQHSVEVTLAERPDQ